MLTSLEQQIGINTDAVLARACRKYEERVSGIESGEQWDNIKVRQNKALEAELKSRGTNNKV